MQPRTLHQRCSRAGNYQSLTESIEITDITYDDSYIYGGFNLYKSLYDLHAQHRDIGSVPVKEEGRVNLGCIGVCGKGDNGWGGLTKMMLTAANMPKQAEMKQPDRVQYLSTALSKINLSVTILPFSLPSEAPTKIEKK